jgi:hypothetical protein
MDDRLEPTAMSLPVAVKEATRHLHFPAFGCFLSDLQLSPQLVAHALAESLTRAGDLFTVSCYCCCCCCCYCCCVTLSIVGGDAKRVEHLDWALVCFVTKEHLAVFRDTIDSAFRKNVR